MSANADGRMRVAFVVPLDPVAIVVTGAGEADHFPGRHVTIAAVNGVSKEAVTRILQQYVKERLRNHALELQRSVFHPGDDPILLVVRELRERLAGVGSATILVEGRQHTPVELSWRIWPLKALLWRRLQKRRAPVKAGRTAISARQLAVDENRAAAILSAGGLRIGWDQSIHQSLDRSAFLGREEHPWPRLDRLGRIAGKRPPRQSRPTLQDLSSCSRRRQEHRGRGQQYTPPGHHC